MRKMIPTRWWQLSAVFANTNRSMCVVWQGSNETGSIRLKPGAALSAWIRNFWSVMAKHSARKMMSAHIANKLWPKKREEQAKKDKKRRSRARSQHLLQTGKSIFKSMSKVTLSQQSLSTRNRSVCKRLTLRSTASRSLKWASTIPEPDLSLGEDKLTNIQSNLCCKIYKLVSMKISELKTL